MNIDAYIKSCMEVREKESQQKNDVLSAIRELIKAQGGDIYIPCMFDEDDYDEDDYNQLVEDEYLVSIGDILMTILKSMCGLRIVLVKIRQ